MSGGNGIAIRIESSSGVLVGIEALQPLVSPTKELLMAIAHSNGPRIDEAELSYGEASIPFAALDGQLLYCTLRMALSSNEDENQWIIAARQRELALAFSHWVAGNEKPTSRTIVEPATIGPIFLLACVLETGNMVRKHGHLRRLVGKYAFEGSYVDQEINKISRAAGDVAFAPSQSYKLH